MPKQKGYSSARTKKTSMTLHIDVRKIEKRIRKPYAPVSKFHLPKTGYKRKAKHQEGEE